MFLWVDQRLMSEQDLNQSKFFQQNKTINNNSQPSSAFSGEITVSSPSSSELENKSIPFHLSFLFLHQPALIIR